jgi:sugar/nucleoside kinase (ribokinase family)
VKAVCLGIHILDVLGLPVPGPPVPGGRIYLDELRITAAGTAAGTAVDLAKLGAEVTSIGAVGDDAAGELITGLMRGHGVDTRRIVRKAAAGTHTSLILGRDNGDRHTIVVYRGASQLLSPEDVDLGVIAQADVLHVGGADALGAFATGPLIEVMEFARANDVTITFDVLGICDRRTTETLAPALGLVKYFFPNEEQLAGMTGTADPLQGARALLETGVECVVGTLGSAGSIVVSAAGHTRVPGFDIEIVDTTGCGDAYAAGFIVASANGWSADAAAWLGTASSALVAGGLGSDVGIVDLDSTLEFLIERAPEPIAALARSLARSRGAGYTAGGTSAATRQTLPG